MYDKGSASITPSSFKQKIDAILPTFAGCNQHDSHEFLISVLDKFFDETCIEAQPVINNVPDIVKEYVTMIESAQDELKKTEDINLKKEIVSTINKFKNDNFGVVA